MAKRTRGRGDVAVKVQKEYTEFRNLANGRREGVCGASEFLFAKALEKAQEKDEIPEDIHFVKAFKGSKSKESFGQKSLGGSDRLFVYTMEPMKETLLDLIKRDIRAAAKYILEMEKIKKDIKTLEKLGFIIADVKPANLMIDKEGKLHFVDYGECKVKEGSIAHRLLREAATEASLGGAY